jgi:predicted phage replisome organizer
MDEKTYFFFKMEDDFFNLKHVKKLRSIAGGDTYCVIYLQMLLKSLKTGGKLYFEGIEETFAEEIALDLNENPDNVKITLDYLLLKCIVTKVDENEYNVNDIGGKIGSKSSTALRVAKHREKVKMLHGNKDVTPMKQNDNGESESESELKIELNYFDPRLKAAWLIWIEYKKDELKFQYKSLKTEQVAINQFNELCKDDYDKAEKLVHKAMTAKWKGIYEDKSEIKKLVIDSTKVDSQQELEKTGIFGVAQR